MEPSRIELVTADSARTPTSNTPRAAGRCRTAAAKRFALLAERLSASNGAICAADSCGASYAELVTVLAESKRSAASGWTRSDLPPPVPDARRDRAFAAIDSGEAVIPTAS